MKCILFVLLYVVCECRVARLCSQYTLGERHVQQVPGQQVPDQDGHVEPLGGDGRTFLETI